MPSWEPIAAQKQAERQSRIPKGWLLTNIPESLPSDVTGIVKTCGILSSEEVQITESYDATELARLIRERKYTSEAVITAFCKRAAIAQQLTNCLTEIFFEDGIDRARWLDQELSRTGKPVGSLHGIPISLKDSFKVKGYDASLGIACLANEPATENSILVDTLLELGAVLYCKTNVSQLLQSLDSENNLFGRTLNPRNREVTAGGSSGGEGALIGMRGSVLGVGTDIGGSIRIPAMCNGLYTLKPSAGRVPYAGQADPQKPGAARVGLTASAGPITTSLRDCELFLKSVATTSPWEHDPDVVYGFWDEQGKSHQKPVIGVVRTDDVVTPLPPVSRVLDETVNALRESGCEVVEVDMSLFKKCQSIANRFFGIDGGHFMLDLLEKSGEPLATWLESRLRKKKPIELGPLTELHAERLALESAMLEIWKDPTTGRRIDAIICPVAPHPTPPIDRWNSVNYTATFVLLDYPAGTLPIRDVVHGDLEGEMQGDVLGNWDKTNRGLWSTESIDRSVYLNTTLCVQVIAPRLQERRLYQAMEYIDGVMQGRSRPEQSKL